LSTETKENAQVATEQQPTETPKFQLIPPFQVSKKAVAAAKSFGVDLSGVLSLAPVVNDWAASIEEWKGTVDNTLKAIVEALPNLPKATIELLKAEAEKQRTQRQQIAQPETPQGPGGTREALVGAIPEIAGLIREAMKGGGGDMYSDLGKKALMSQISMSEAITNAVVSKITGKAIQEVAEVVTGA
jgi:hypothetical protein